MARTKHLKGGNCPKSKSSNWTTRKDIKNHSSGVARDLAKEEIKEQLLEFYGAEITDAILDKHGDNIDELKTFLYHDRMNNEQ